METCGGRGMATVNKYVRFARRGEQTPQWYRCISTSHAARVIYVAHAYGKLLCGHVGWGKKKMYRKKDLCTIGWREKQ